MLCTENKHSLHWHKAKICKSVEKNFYLFFIQSLIDMTQMFNGTYFIYDYYYVPKHTYYYCTIYNTIYTPNQHHILLYINIHPYTHHIPLLHTIYPYTTYTPIYPYTTPYTLHFLMLYRSIWCCIWVYGVVYWYMVLYRGIWRCKGVYGHVW